MASPRAKELTPSLLSATRNQGIEAMVLTKSFDDIPGSATTKVLENIGISSEVLLVIV